MSDLSGVLIVLAPIACGFGTYGTMEAIASKNYVMGLASSLLSVLSGLLLGKVMWGGIL